MAKSLFTKRLSKELRDLNTNPIEGVLIEEADDFKRWRLQLTGAPGTIYENEEFKLEFRFTPSYPLESPEVLFIRPHIPIHPQYIPMAISASTYYIKIGHQSRPWLKFVSRSNPCSQVVQKKNYLRTTIFISKALMHHQRKLLGHFSDDSV